MSRNNMFAKTQMYSNECMAIISGRILSDFIVIVWSLGVVETRVILLINAQYVNSAKDVV